jgi:hypothetical protein
MAVYIGDLQTQERILAHQTQYMPDDMKWNSFRMLHKRVAKHFGLTNRYKGDGTLRKK